MSSSQEPSYVLRAAGPRPPSRQQRSLRFGLGRFTTAADIEAAILVVTQAVARLRRLNPD